MVSIEYDGKVVNVPESWEDVTVGQYEAWGLDEPQTARERVEYVARICQVEPEILLAWPAEVFNRIVEYIGFVFDNTPVEPCPYVDIDGVRFIINIEHKITTGEWVDAEAVQENGEAIISNMLAILCRPIGEAYNDENNDTRQAMFASQPLGKVRGVLAFFLQCKTVSDKRIESFSRLVEACDLLPPSIKPFLNGGAGTKLSRIWQAVTYSVLMRLLYYRLRRYLLSLSTSKTKVRRIRRSGN